MPPLYVKGGVWTNAEDEVLKAAVSKYGLNQWARVSSLLSKKSAKQAKARWYEYLSPSINKNPWDRQEDEKLLSLAKLLPNQWRSIAGVIGRTATQCVERYQRLLEDEVREGDELKLSGPGIETLPASGAAVGDIITNAESQPSRPDLEEMDEEEKEMLWEARARLANTQGKKAKRKSRERMLEESRRVALLQKRRDMKEAGVNLSLQSRNKKRRNEFDYNGDIAHEHAPLPGLYDTTEETKQNEHERSTFTAEVQRLGLEPERKKKKKDKQPKSSTDEIKAAAELINEAELHVLKKRHLALPEVDATEVVEGQDDRIQQHTRELRELQAEKSALTGEPVSRTRDTKVKAEGVSEKELRHTIHARWSALPPPKNKSAVVIPSFGTQEQTITIDTTTDIDEGERARQMELLRQVDEQKALLRRSQAVQRGLSIPKPSSLLPIEVSGVEGLVVKEMHRLIKSDYAKFEDPSFTAHIVDDLDEDTLAVVNKVVEAELQTGPDPEVGVPHEDTAANLEALRSLRRSNGDRAEALETGIAYDDYRVSLADALDNLKRQFTSIQDTDIDLDTYLRAANDEERAIEHRQARLHRLVDELVHAESRLQEQLRSSTV